MLPEPGGLLPGDERKSFYRNYQYPMSLCNKTSFDKIIPGSLHYYKTKQNLPPLQRSVQALDLPPATCRCAPSRPPPWSSSGTSRRSRTGWSPATRYGSHLAEFYSTPTVSGVLQYDAPAVPVPVGVPVCGQQQADHHLRPHPPHHLHHQSGGLHQHRARASLNTCPGHTAHYTSDLFTQQNYCRLRPSRGCRASPAACPRRRWGAPASSCSGSSRTTAGRTSSATSSTGTTPTPPRYCITQCCCASDSNEQYCRSLQTTRLLRILRQHSSCWRTFTRTRCTTCGWRPSRGGGRGPPHPSWPSAPSSTVSQSGRCRVNRTLRQHISSRSGLVW